MLYLKKSASLAYVTALTAVSLVHVTACAESDRATLLAQYEDLSQQTPELIPATLIPAAAAELLDPQFTESDAGQGDLWDRIRKGFAIQELNNPLVTSHRLRYGARPEGSPAPPHAIAPRPAPCHDRPWPWVTLLRP